MSEGRVALAPGAGPESQDIHHAQGPQGPGVKWNENTKSTPSLSPTLGSEQAVRGMDASRQRSCMQGGGRQGGRAKVCVSAGRGGKSKKRQHRNQGWVTQDGQLDRVLPTYFHIAL